MGGKVGNAVRNLRTMRVVPCTLSSGWAFHSVLRLFKSNQI